MKYVLCFKRIFWSLVQLQLIQYCQKLVMKKQLGKFATILKKRQKILFLHKLLWKLRSWEEIRNW